MSAYFRVLRIGLVSLAIFGVISTATSGAAQSVSAAETVRSVARMLERLPYYGLFDYMPNDRFDRVETRFGGVSGRGPLAPRDGFHLLAQRSQVLNPRGLHFEPW